MNKKIRFRFICCSALYNQVKGCHSKNAELFIKDIKPIDNVSFFALSGQP